MKRKVIRMVSLLLTLILLCTGCVTPKKISTLFPHYEELSALIGLTMDEALEKMGWQEEDVPERWNLTYDIPVEAEISGVPVSVMCVFLEKLTTIDYLAEFPDDMENAMKDTLRIIGEIGSALGEKVTWSDTEIDMFHITEAELQEIVEGRRFNKIQLQWDLSSAASSSTKKYMKELKEEPGYIMDPMYSLTLTLSRVEDTVYLRLSVGVHYDMSSAIKN